MKVDSKQRDRIIKELDPDYFLCETCNEYSPITSRCKQKMLGQSGQIPRIIPCNYPLCISCNGGKEYREWTVSYDDDIVAVFEDSLPEDLTSIVLK